MKRLYSLFFAVAVACSHAMAQESPPERKSKYDDPRLNTPIPFTFGD